MLSNQTLSPFFVFHGIATLFLEIIYSLVTSAKLEAILFLFGCSEVNSTWLITSELANQRAQKTLFTCVVYTNASYVQSLLYVKKKKGRKVLIAQKNAFIVNNSEPLF